MSSPVEPRATRESLAARLHRTLGPIAGGLLLDALDLALFGPLGLTVGGIVGILVGWWLGGLYGLTTRGRRILAAASAIYLMLPFTEILPLATAAGAVARFREQPPTEPP